MNKEKMTAEEWLDGNGLSIDIFNKKYRNGKETFQQWLERVSGGNKEVKRLIVEKKFLFGGRILANRGLDKHGIKTTLSNCYVLSVDDSIESIYQCCSDMARTYSYGGGVGIDISKLRPRGAYVNNSAKTTSGAVSFMNTFDVVTATIGQNGRRGALMISIDVRHPDVVEFVNVKKNTTEITNANISVRSNDEFMNAVKNKEDFFLRFPCEQECSLYEKRCSEYNKLYCFEKEDGSKTYIKKVNAEELFMNICKNNWQYGEPGFLYWNRAENWHLKSEDKEFKYAGINPCLTGDTLIAVADGRNAVSIKELAKEKINFPVYSARIRKTGCRANVVSKTWKTEIKNAVAFKTGTKNVVRVVLSDGSSFKCTSDHRLATKDCNYIEAANSIGMRLEPFNTAYTSNVTYDDVIVVRIDNLGEEDVYDLSVEDNHNFYIITKTKDDKYLNCSGILVHNCGELKLPDGGACLLGSINVSAYESLEELKKDAKTAATALIEAQIENIPLHPLEKQRNIASKYREIGLGIMGLADLFIKRGIVYGSDESAELAKEVMRTVLIAAYEASCDYNKDNVCYFPKIKHSAFYKDAVEPYLSEYYRNREPYNSQLLTIPPTGSIATMLNISGGCEPMFATSYTRKTKSIGENTYKVYPKIVEEYMKNNGIETEEDLPEYFFATAHNIKSIDRVKVQSALQSFIDSSISSTVNLANSATVDEIHDIYFKSWELGCVGTTVFRDGCERASILSTKTEKSEEKREGIEYHTAPKRPKRLKADFHVTRNNGQTFFVMVGLMGDRPYEVFACRADGRNAEKCSGELVKNAKNDYSFVSEQITIDHIVQSDLSQEERDCTMYVSMLLRHGVPVRQIVKTARKTNPVISSFTSAVCRILGRYAEDEESGETCPDCGGRLIHVGGCVECENKCGYSKCQ